MGILCLTPENVHSDWLLFEAGALSKRLDKARVCPLLFGLGNSDLRGPLVQFQTAVFDREEIHRLFTTVNANMGERRLQKETLDKVFEKWWPDLEKTVSEILSESSDGKSSPPRTDRDLLTEVVEIARHLKDRSSDIGAINGRAVVHLVKHFGDVHRSIKERSPHEAIMTELQEFAKSVEYISEKLSSITPSDPAIDFTVWGELEYECDPPVSTPAPDDIPF